MSDQSPTATLPGHSSAEDKAHTATPEGPAPPAARRMRLWVRMAKVAFFGALLAGVVILFMLIQSRAKPHTATPGAPGAGAPPVQVHTVKLEARDIELAPRYLGRTEASQSVEIRNRVSGFLNKRMFTEGTKVNAGDPLYEIDPEPYQAEVDVAAADLESAEARAEQARTQLARMQSLIESGGGTPVELDQALTDNRVATASVHLAEARLAQARLDLGYTKISAPISGMIGLSQRDVGTYLQTGANSLLATIEQIDPLYVTYSISEQELLHWRTLIASGTVRVPEEKTLPLTLSLIDGSQFPHIGYLNFVGISVDPTTGTAIIRGEFPNPEGGLKPGQFVRVTVGGITRPGTIVVPQPAVLFSPGGASVYVVTSDNLAEPRTVKLGEWHGNGWIVEDGLRAGERVAIDMLMRLRPGSPVSAIDTPAPPDSAPPTGDAAPPASSEKPAATPAKGGAR